MCRGDAFSACGHSWRGRCSRGHRDSAPRPDYLASTHEDICLILQIENQAGLEAAEEIAAVEGVDALFIGPSDLAGSLGHLGDPGHPEVQQAIAAVLRAAKNAGKAAGIYATSAEKAKQYAGEGVAMVSVGSDIGLLASGSRALRQSLGS